MCLHNFMIVSDYACGATCKQVMWTLYANGVTCHIVIKLCYSPNTTSSFIPTLASNDILYIQYIKEIEYI